MENGHGRLYNQVVPFFNAALPPWTERGGDFAEICPHFLDGNCLHKYDVKLLWV